MPTLVVDALADRRAQQCPAVKVLLLISFELQAAQCLPTATVLVRIGSCQCRSAGVTGIDLFVDDSGAAQGDLETLIVVAYSSADTVLRNPVVTANDVHPQVRVCAKAFPEPFVVFVDLVDIVGCQLSRGFTVDFNIRSVPRELSDEASAVKQFDVDDIGVPQLCN